MPNRILRDGILSSEKVNALNWAEEVFYRRLMSVVDDHGRFHALPKLLRAACYPLHIDKVSDADIGKWITSCVTAGLVSVYPAADGKRYIQILNFGQQVRAKSKFPNPIDCSGEQLKSSDIKCNQLPANEHLGVFGDGVVCGDEGDSNGANPPPSQEAKATDICPHQEVIDLYHDILPSARRIRDWTPSRQSVLRARWREDKARQNLDWWRDFFEYIARCDFLMGRVSTPGRMPFDLCLDWILKPSNFIKIIEGAYENREATV